MKPTKIIVPLNIKGSINNIPTTIAAIHTPTQEHLFVDPRYTPPVDPYRLAFVR